MLRSPDRLTPVRTPSSLSNATPVESSFGLADGLFVAVLFAGTIAYVASLPRSLGWADESFFLYEAKRVRDGEVMYRDIFQFIPPLASWTMAALFWLFGTSMATARLTMAVLHGATGTFIFLSCRQLAVRRSFAALAVLGYLVLCQAAWPYASWHWFSTGLSALLLLVLLMQPLEGTARRAMVPGLVAGLLIGVQHQKGIVMTAAAAVVLCSDSLVRRRFGQPSSVRDLAARLVWLGAGVIVIVVPIVAVCIVTAGFAPVYDGLVRFPFETYRQHFHIGWGQVAPLAESFATATFPAVLRWAPLAAVIPLVRALVDTMRLRQPDRVCQRAALVIVSAAAAVSIGYFPDVIHLAFIAPAFLVCAGDALEWIVAFFRFSPRADSVVAVAAMAVAAVLVVRLSDNAVTAWQAFPIAHDTAFGHVDFATRWEPLMIDGVRDLLQQAPSAEIFCYPNLSEPYLTTGAHNPTRFQWFQAGVSPAQHVDEVMAMLEARRPPYLIVASYLLPPNDPIGQLIARAYRSAPIPGIGDTGELPAFYLYQRSDLPPLAGGRG